MRFQTILGVGVVAIIAYLLYYLFASKTVAAGVQSAITSTTNTFENAATGGLSDAQQADLINEEASGLVTASGGTMTPAQAKAQAQADLQAANASGAPTYWDGVKAAFSSL